MSHLFWLLLAAALPGESGSPVEFENQVIPVLTKAGCNTGACHGAAVGRGGFKLSLYGGDPESDYRAIVRELEGRRVNFVDPDQSLVVMKPTEAMEHGGGYRLDPDGKGARLIAKWIGQGARRQAGADRELLRVEVTPTKLIAEDTAQTVALSATAFYSDGTQRDVTEWTVFQSEDPASVMVDPKTAVAKLQRRGRHIVVARFLNHVVPIEIIVPLSDQSVSWQPSPNASLIDEYVSKRLAMLRIPPSPPAGDLEFVRRIHFDLTGRLPTPDTVRRFAVSAASDDKAAQRRVELVDQLLNSEAFDQYWTMKLAKLFRVRAMPQDSQGAEALHQWLADCVRTRVGYDQIAREVLTATGDTHLIGSAYFYRLASGPREQAELVSELFMGSRLRCANCHNHPLDRWTQDDYHGLAAIFAKLRSEKNVEFNADGRVVHPRTQQNAIPKIPGENWLPVEGDNRKALADWLTDPENPYFAKAIVNRLWQSMMGRGLIEPVDDLRATNPATHPELLDELTADFVQHGYDLRHTLRLIATSETYARSHRATESNASDDRYYSHMLVKPLEAEVLADAICDVLNVPGQYGDEPMGTRAVALVDPRTESEALDVLGRCSREESCETSAGATGGLTRKLHLFNGRLLNEPISDPSGRLQQWIQQGLPPKQIIRRFYVLTLGRMPSEDEMRFWSEQVDGTPEPSAVLEDFVWSLLTCNEFVTNH